MHLFAEWRSEPAKHQIDVTVEQLPDVRQNRIDLLDI
jgi:hypothetical protein